MTVILSRHVRFASDVFLQSLPLLHHYLDVLSNKVKNGLLKLVEIVFSNVVKFGLNHFFQNVELPFSLYMFPVFSLGLNFFLFHVC